MATEYEALQRARELANQTNQTWFVVTSREAPDMDYDVAQAGSLNRQHIVCGHVVPESDHDEAEPDPLACTDPRGHEYNENDYCRRCGADGRA